MRLRLDVDHVGREKHQCFSLYLRLANAPAMVSSMPLNAMPRAAIQFTPVCGSAVASCTGGSSGLAGAITWSGVASCTGGSSGVSGVTTSSGVSTSSSWGGVGSSGSAGVVTVKFFRATVVKL